MMEPILEGIFEQHYSEAAGVILSGDSSYGRF